MIPIIIMAIENDDERDFMIRLYIDYKALMRKQAAERLDDDFFVEDVVQETCERLIKNIDTIMHISRWALPSYIALTVRSAAVECNKRESADDAANAGEIGEQFVDSSVDIEAEVLSKYELEAVKNAIEKLPQKYKDALNYKYFLNMDNDEIAKALDIKPAGVYMYIKRARQKLLEIINEEDE